LRDREVVAARVAMETPSMMDGRTIAISSVAAKTSTSVNPLRPRGTGILPVLGARR
jgi:hypothetical protein